MKWWLNNTVGIIKKIPYHWFNDHCWEYKNFNHCHSHMFISEMIAIKLINLKYEFAKANYDVGHTYGINWKWNNWYHFHFYFKLPSHVFSTDKISVWKTEVSVISMANDMYFIQWITISYKMAMNYIEIIMCASKLHVFNLLVFCPDSTDEMLQNTIMLWWYLAKT